MNDLNKNTITIIICAIVMVISITVLVLYFVNPFKPKVNPVPVKETEQADKTTVNPEDSIELVYYEGYNVATGDAISDTIPVIKINITGDNYTKIMNYIDKLEKDDRSCENEYDCMLALYDKYKLNLPNNKSLLLSDEYCQYEEDFDIFYKTPNELYTIINNIANDYNEKNLYKKINSNSITLVYEGRKINLTGEDLTKVSNFKYYYINDKDENYKNDKVEYTLELGDGRTIEVFAASTLGRITNKDNTHKYVYISGLDAILDNIVKK